MQVHQKTLAQLLGSARRFVIPEFQRPYVWTREEVEQLWNDLREAFEEHADEGPDHDGQDYFLGPVFVAQRRDETGAPIASVVDGQQRLTTLHALLWAAFHRLSTERSPAGDQKSRELERLLLTPSGEATLGVAREDQADFHALQHNVATDENRDLGRAGAWLRSKLSGYEPGNLVPFLNYIQNRVVFVYVEAESFAAAWDLFIGLNGKGRPLIPADLIKAFVCGTSRDSSAMAAIWQERILPLGDDATSALLDIVRVGTGEPGSDAKLFRIFEKAWTAGKVESALLSQGAHVYMRYWLTPLVSLEKERTLGPGRRALRALRELRRRDHTQVVLAMGLRFGIPTVLAADFLAAFEAFQFWMAVRGKHGREKDFTALAHRIHEQRLSEAEARAELRTLLAHLAPTVEEVRMAVRNAAYPGRIMKFIVQQYEEGQRGDVEVADVQYEHMMPQTPTEYWNEVAGTRDANEYARIVNNIGNIVPLDGPGNVTVSNSAWPVKCAWYQANVRNWLVADIARRNPDGWKAEKIRARAEELAEWAVTRRWNLPERLKALESSR